MSSACFNGDTVMVMAEAQPRLPSGIDLGQTFRSTRSVQVGSSLNTRYSAHQLVGA